MTFFFFTDLRILIPIWVSLPDKFRGLVNTHWPLVKMSSATLKSFHSSLAMVHYNNSREVPMAE